VHEDLSVAQIGNVGLDDFEVVGLRNIGRPGFQNDLTVALQRPGAARFAQSSDCR